MKKAGRLDPHSPLFTFGSQPGARTISTGTHEERTIFSATLPITQRLTPERPWLAITIKSTSFIRHQEGNARIYRTEKIDLGFGIHSISDFGFRIGDFRDIGFGISDCGLVWLPPCNPQPGTVGSASVPTSIEHPVSSII
jgi:hypothetical protein